MPKDPIQIRSSNSRLADLYRELLALRSDIVAETACAQHRIEAVHDHYQASAQNLLHYLALRRRDLRGLQQRLAELGLSSLGRAESHVLATIDAVMALLRRLTDAPEAVPTPAAAAFDEGRRLLAEHTEQLLGPMRAERKVRIMVTMPALAADDGELLRQLLEQGMDCIRINCAHDEPATWLRIIENLRRAERALGRSCRVAMDLGGPKLRTGPLLPGPQVMRVKPARDAYGRVAAPARIWLAADPASRPPPGPADACLAMAAHWLARLRPDDRVSLKDARGSRRTLTVADALDGGCWLESPKTIYFVPETVLQHHQRGTKAKAKARASQLKGVAPGENVILLREGDLLVLTRDATPGHPAIVDDGGRTVAPARIGCTLPEVFDDVRSGEAICFDDGKIGGTIENVEDEEVHVRITHARAGGEKLRADKGINLPDSALHLAALTAKDIEDLAFVAEHADIVELSFPNSAADVLALQQRLAELGGRQPAIVLKIETRRGFENLPDMLLTAMGSPCCGVMIARGDLAVESGFERLAEVQEEILWVCEAAHVPVIWATQVLESLARSGKPSRAEITDAAMGDRAECVMLNKGPHVVDALKTLDDILRRMQAHQAKKHPMLRMLKLAHAFP